jgi:hypothetical protein
MSAQKMFGYKSNLDVFRTCDQVSASGIIIECRKTGDDQEMAAGTDIVSTLDIKNGDKAYIVYGFCEEYDSGGPQGYSALPLAIFDRKECVPDFLSKLDIVAGNLEATDEAYGSRRSLQERRQKFKKLSLEGKFSLSTEDGQHFTFESLPWDGWGHSLLSIRVDSTDMGAGPNDKPYHNFDVSMNI